MNLFKQCPNEHYYQGDECPYCDMIKQESDEPQRSEAPLTPAKNDEDTWNPLNNTTEGVVFVDGHGYTLCTFNKTASFQCWSEHTLDEYIRYWLSDYDYRIKNFTKRVKSNEKAFAIPSEIEYAGIKYSVNRIRNGAFAFCSVDAITISDTIEQIDRQAFFRCDGLKTLFIPDSVKKLANEAISECKDLETITWKGVTYEDDIDELFVFPDNINKYAVILHDKN